MADIEKLNYGIRIIILLTQMHLHFDGVEISCITRRKSHLKYS